MKMKKLAASLLLAACTFACACGSDKGGNGGPTADGIIKENDNYLHYVENTLHDVNIDEKNPAGTLIVNGQSNYKIIVKSGAAMTHAGYLSQQYGKATGVTIPVSMEDSVLIDENTEYILFGFDDEYVSVAGGEIPSYDTLGVAGYHIKTYGKNVFVSAYTSDGYHMSVLALLRTLVGYDMLAEDCVIFEKDGKILPQMDITERPDFDYRNQSGSLTNTEVYGMGYTASSIFVNTGESWMHNWWDYVSPEEVKDGEADRKWMSNDETMWQGCWTAHGDKDSYLRMIDFLTEKVKMHLKNNPTVDNIVIGQHDVAEGTPTVGACKCDTCQASYAYYGTMAGAWLSLCNRISLNVDAWLETEEAKEIFGENKEFNLIQLTYGQSINPPAERDEKGNFLVDPTTGGGVPLEEVWFNEKGEQEVWVDETINESEDYNFDIDFGTGKRLYTAPSVQFLWAASQADYTHSYYEPENTGFSNRVKTWSGFGGDFYVWLYNAAFQAYHYPYNTFDTAYETTRYFKEMGAKYIFWQGLWENKNNTGFVSLRQYLETKVEFDVNADYQYYLNKFFRYFYGDAGETMKKFFDEVTLRCREIETVNNIVGTIHSTRITDKENWPQGLINSWMDLLDEAYEDLAQCKKTDPDAYEIYSKHILVESLFPRFVLCTSYADTYNEMDRKAMRQQFADDFFALGNTTHREHGSISEIFNNWELD